MTPSTQPRRLSRTTYYAAALVTVVGLAWQGWRTHDSVAAPPVDAARPANKAPASPPPPRNVIEALRRQITDSSVLQDADTDGQLLRSLDTAEELFLRAKQQNRDALRRLNRQSRPNQPLWSPNLIVITVEQLGQPWGDAGAEFRSWKSWAAEGVAFTNYYSGGGDADTGWWTLMTGLNSGHANHGPAELRALRSVDESLARWLWKGGYETAYLGPWSGRVHPLLTGFESWTGWLSPQQPTEYPAELSTAQTVMRVPGNMNGQRTTSAWRLLDVEVANLLDRQAEHGRPLFLQVRLPRLTDLSDEQNRAAWDQFVSGVFRELNGRTADRRTCVLFTALTGASTGPDDLSERALRAPLIVRWPDHLPGGVTVDRVTAAWDVAPTLAELASISSRPKQLDGTSFAPSLARRPQDEPKLLYWRSPTSPGTQAVRKGPWKAIYANDNLRLYDLHADPTETTDVVGQHRDIARELVKGPADIVDRVLK